MFTQHEGEKKHANLSFALRTAIKRWQCINHEVIKWLKASETSRNHLDLFYQEAGLKVALRLGGC